MKLRRKSKAREPKLKGDELDDLAQQAADEASTPPVTILLMLQTLVFDHCLTCLIPTYSAGAHAPRS